MLIRLCAAMLLVTAATAHASEPTTQAGTPTEAAQQIDALLRNNWQVEFQDDGTGDWKDKWVVEGEHAKVTSDDKGMTFTAGPRVDDAHHAVLWTRQQFTGDVRIDFDYTRLDDATQFVNILYIQATGSLAKGKGPDIHKWADQRQVPSMWQYYKHMHLYHISFAAFDVEGEPYIRARRYMAGRVDWPDGTQLPGEYAPKDLFAKGVPHHITVIKQDRDLWMRITNADRTVNLHWHNKNLPPVLAGYVGLRHMHTRSARYANFKIATPAPDPSTAIDAVVEDARDLRTDLATPVTTRASDPLYYTHLNLQHGMHHDGTTYFAFHGGAPDDDDPYVMAYHHKDKGFEGPVKVADTALPDSDDHGNPGLIVDAKGYVHVIFGGHGVAGKMQHFRTARPGDISEWQELANIDPGTTYPKLFRMSDGTIYYTCRAGNHREDHKLYASADHGVTFGTPLSFLAGGSESGKAYNDKKYAPVRYHDGWYTHAIKGIGDSIHFQFFYHACADDGRDPNRGIYHGERRTNLYYLKYEHKTATWHTVDGTDITEHLPLTIEKADRLCRVYESKEKAEPGKIDTVGMAGLGVTPDDRPIISFLSGSDFRIQKTTTAWLALGEKDGWRFVITGRDPGTRVAGMPDDIESLQVFSLVNGSGVLRTTDGGKSWTRTHYFREHPDEATGVRFLAPIFQPHPDARYIGGGNKRHADRDAMGVYIWGDSGFLKPSPDTE